MHRTNVSNGRAQVSKAIRQVEKGRFAGYESLADVATSAYHHGILNAESVLGYALPDAVRAERGGLVR